MSRFDPSTPRSDPWTVPVAVAQIPDTGLHRDIVADPRELAAMAADAGLREILSANAAFDLTPAGEGRVRVVGRVKARVGQTCVVTLEPVENEVDEAIDLIFAPASQIRELAESIDDTRDPDVEIPDPPEPIVKGFIDIGRVATDAVFLGLDPYPRKVDAVFEPPPLDADPDEHPFAALKALQTGRTEPDPK